MTTLIATRTAKLIGQNGRKIKLTSGEKLTKSQVKNLFDRQRFSYTIPYVNVDRVYYTREELVELTTLYINNDNVAWVRDQFMTNNPNNLHSASSINACVGQLRTLDSRRPNDTQWVVKSLVAEVAVSMDSRRFQSI